MVGEAATVKVYIAGNQPPYEGIAILGVYSSREKAEQRLSKAQEDGESSMPDWDRIEEYELDD